MYHWICRRIARKNFERINRKDYQGLLGACVDNVRHRFGGDHALGGRRQSRAALARWLQRLGRLSPTLQLRVLDVWSTGWPHDTTIIVRWEATQEMPDQSDYLNHGVHVIKMRWGKIVEIDANEDSQLVAESLRIWGNHGNPEALAPPILQ